MHFAYIQFLSAAQNLSSSFSDELIADDDGSSRLLSIKHRFLSMLTVCGCLLIGDLLNMNILYTNIFKIYFYFVNTFDFYLHSFLLYFSYLFYIFHFVFDILIKIIIINNIILLKNVIHLRFNGIRIIVRFNEEYSQFHLRTIEILATA